MSNERVRGLADVQRALETLPVKVEQNIMRGAMRAGAKVILAGAQATSSFVDRTGELRETLRVQTSTRGGTVSATVTAGRSKKSSRGWYAPLVEKGTAPHVIEAQPGGLLAIGYKRVHHPGAAPHPFMVPAFDAHHRQAVEAVAAYARKRLATKHGIDVAAPREEGDE